VKAGCSAVCFAHSEAVSGRTDGRLARTSSHSVITAGRRGAEKVNFAFLEWCGQRSRLGVWGARLRLYLGVASAIRGCIVHSWVGLAGRSDVSKILVRCKKLLRQELTSEI
jgi:hypothetical protein